MIVADYIASILKQNRITTVFGYQGGNISCLIDSLSRGGIHFVENYNEQGSSFAANSYAEVTDNFGVAISSSGPGAINMLNGIANAYCDSIPCLFITGDVSTYCRQKYKGVRQSEFQEIDIISVAKPITKKVYDIVDTSQVEKVLTEAIQIMSSGRKGPVLINMPHNIQKSEITTSSNVENNFSNYHDNCLQQNNVESIIEEILNHAVSPCVLLGNGSRSNISTIQEFITKNQLLFACTLKALDLFPESPYYLGFAGNYGTEKAKSALSNADVLVVIGARMDIRVLSAINIASTKRVIHIDIDPFELEKDISCEYLTINADITKINFSKIHLVSKQCVLTNDTMHIDNGQLTFKSFFSNFNNSTPTIYSIDVGLHQMAAAKYLQLKEGDRVLNSGGLGAMGYSLPSAIGAFFANRDIQNVCFTGDGGIQMNIQELETIRREKLPIKVFVLNNNCLGMIRNYQDFALGKRHYATIDGFSSPSYEKIVAAYSMTYFKIDNIDNINTVWRLAQMEQNACLIEVVIPTNDNID